MGTEVKGNTRVGAKTRGKPYNSAMAKRLTKAKAKKILRHGSVRGKPLTKKQKGLFGAKAGGKKLRRRR